MFINFNSTEKKKNKFSNDSSIDFTTFVEHDRAQRGVHFSQSSIDTQLSQNYTQIQELFKERKRLLSKKAEQIIHDNKHKLQSISSARQQDLRNQAKMIGDRSTEQLIETADSFHGPKQLLQKITEISNMTSFESVQKDQGKRFWDLNKEYEKEMKKKNELYVSQTRQLHGVNEKVRSIFVEIERLQSQMIGLLTKDRRDPDYLRRAQKFNEEIQKKKLVLRDAKMDKEKMKTSIQKTIQSILEFNRKNETAFKKRANDLDEMFGGNQSIVDFDAFLSKLERVVESKAEETRNEEVHFKNLQKIIKQYDFLVEECEKYKKIEDEIFQSIEKEQKDKIKLYMVQRAYFPGLTNPRDQFELVKKCRSYRKMLIDIDSERPIINETLSKVLKMTKVLYPMKKSYESEESRKMQLIERLGYLMIEYNKIEKKLRDQRDYAFDMDSLKKRREVIEVQLDECAQKANFNEYKNKVKELQKIEKQIEERKDSLNIKQMRKEEEILVQELEQLNEKYKDIIEEIIVDDKKMHIAAYLNKLHKRLNLL